MTYETVDQISQMISLALFLALFIGAVIYAFWPGNAGDFDRAARVPLMNDPESPDHGGIDER